MDNIQDFFIFNTTQHNGYIKSTTQFNKGVRNKPTILAKMKISKLTKTRCYNVTPSLIGWGANLESDLILYRDHM